MIKNIKAITLSAYLSMFFLGVSASLVGAAAQNIGLSAFQLVLARQISLQIALLLFPLSFLISFLILYIGLRRLTSTIPTSPTTATG